MKKYLRPGIDLIGIPMYILSGGTEAMVLPWAEKTFPTVDISVWSGQGLPQIQSLSAKEASCVDWNCEHIDTYQPVGQNHGREQTLAWLREMVFRCEAQWRPAQSEKAISTGHPALDRLLPFGGWRWGTLVEWVAPDQGVGAKWVALGTLRPMISQGCRLVVVDGQRQFYPPAVAAAGIPLDQILLVYPQTKRELLWAMGQILGAGRGVILWADLPSCTAATYRRLALAAEQSGSLGFLFRSCRAINLPCWADVQIAIRPLPLWGTEARWRWQVKLLRARGAFVPEEATVEIFWDEWAHRWGEPSPLAHPAAAVGTSAGA